MLVLSRKKNESIVINNEITVSVVEIRGDKVRLGIVAPRECSVHRQEVWLAIHGIDSRQADLSQFSPEEAAFLRSILDAPEDLCNRLVYADWLEERGDVRGEFIRIVCQLAQLPANAPERKPLEEREQLLWLEHGTKWRLMMPSVFYLLFGHF